MTATILKTLTFIACCAPVWQGITENNDPLLFPVDDYTVETRTVRTAAGEKQVTLHSYRHIPYVAKPIDRDYQSLDVTVPVAIDGIAVDAVDAPILFNIGVGGYLSVKNTARERDDGRGTPPSGRASGRGPGNPGTMSSKPDLALAAGYVVVSPGCRGRDNRAADGAYYGKAPAAIVDLKAAVRYLRHNRGVMSGNTDWIVSTGCSAGGALSALLGASGNSPLYGKYLQEIGAADEDDAIYASACYSPITDLEHSDMSYEWMYGSVPTRSGLVDQELSRQLRAAYAEYQESLQLAGRNGFGILRADNFDAYLLQFYLIPSANKYLNALADEEREKYLENNPWITWNGSTAAFAFSDYVAHVGRMKGLPAFDDFNLTAPEPSLFGDERTDARHFANTSLRYTSGDPNAEINDELKIVVNMMNAMTFIGQDNRGCAHFWWLRNGARDNHNSQTVMVNLAASLENRDKDVNAWIFWEGGHCADDDPQGFIDWLGQITGFVH